MLGVHTILLYNLGLATEQHGPPNKLVEKHTLINTLTRQPPISFATQVALLGEQPSVTILGNLNPVCWLHVRVLLRLRWWC